MLTEVFKALADPHRRTILTLLRKGDLNVSQIAEHVPVTGATLSHHLDTLKRADLVLAERRGQFVYYSLNTSVFEEVLKAFRSYFSR